MTLPLVTGIAVVALLVLLRQVGRLGVLRGQGQFVWLMFMPALIGGFLILGVGVQMLITTPPAGVVMIVTGGVYVASLIGFLTPSSRSVTARGAEAMIEPLVDYAQTVGGLVLIGGLAALVGLAVWAASQAAH
jgi:hypothetical protein